ncbi:protein FAM124A-like isoform X2 [Lytechinus variegatus]|uniref:protein FAM124A-like isoform X2 n=1 Tax=Lytechinus variegatus TaxID=7654 RepID=UPI001BB27094|nr:protein FAM124A-like isoform X2 [Lytechinus variegatus]
MKFLGVLDISSTESKGSMFCRAPPKSELIQMPIDPASPQFGMSSPSGSSVSSEESNDGDLTKDPYGITLHFVTDPGESIKLRKLIHPLVKHFDHSFKMFNIAERSRPNGQFNKANGGARDIFPALSVMLFLHIDEDVDDRRISSAQEYLARKPWKYHHNSRVPGKLYLCEPNFQNFYTTEQDMPLWAVRQVHYGKEHLRFMLYASRENWEDMIRFYTLVLNRKVEYQKEDFCYFVTHTRDSSDIQFALKRIPEDYSVRPLYTSFLQFKVREIGELVPLLPNSCSPISPQRWQTTDPDGNVTLILVTKKVGTNNNSTLTPRRQSVDVLQQLIAPKPLKPKAKQALQTVLDEDEEDSQ